jgi:hypothetical protein
LKKEANVGNNYSQTKKLFMPNNKTLEFIANLFASAVEQAYEPKIVALLQKLHDTNINAYKTAIFGLNAAVVALQPLVADTPTQLDDGFVGAIEEVVTTSAGANGVDLNAA